MGNGLLNALSEANGRDDRVAARRYVSSSFLMLAGLALALAAAFAVVYPFVPWQEVFNVSSPEAGPAMAALVGCFLVSLPLGVVEKVQLGYQEGFRNALWTAFGNMLGLGAVLLAIALGAGLPWLILAIAGAPAIARLANGVALFGWHKRWLRPTLGWATRPAARRVLQIGLLFFVLQLAVAVAYQSDSIVAVHVVGPQAVAEYAVVYRLFMLVPMLVGMALTPLWPAYGEAIARGDVAWVRRTLLRSLWISLLATAPAALLLVALGSRIIELWAGSEIVPSFGLLLGFGVWMVMGTAGNAVAMFLNGANIVRFQVLTAISMAVTNLALSIVLARSIGVAGVIWGTVLAYGCVVGPLYSVAVRRYLRRESPQGIH
jgi:O-antigen/teichoic acid export membrane protein